MVTVEAYKDGRYAQCDVQRLQWETERESQGETLYQLMTHLTDKRPIVGEPDAYQVRGESLHRFGGRVRGGPADGEYWEHDTDHWALPVYQQVPLMVDEPPMSPYIVTADYRWAPTGWEWDGYH